jgi:glycosyltransferase involved in cell wall biosynthesis
MIHKQQVAVILPVFNAERTIAATLGSILAQTHDALDIIVVDDGSTDASISIVQAMQRSDARIRYVRQPNAGAAAARNAGASLATAPFLAFCDADDLWAPRKIELQLQRMQLGGTSLALVYCWFARIDGADKVLSINRSGSEGHILTTLLRRNVIGNGSSPLFRRTAFESIGGFTGRLSHAEDLAIYLATAERYEIGVVPQILVGYRVSKDSLSSSGIDVYLQTSKVMKHYALRYPGMATAITLHLRGVLMWQIVMSLRHFRFGAALRLLRCDYGLIGTVVGVYVPELMLNLWRGTIKDTWLGVLTPARHRSFGALTEAPAHHFANPRAAPSPDTR